MEPIAVVGIGCVVPGALSVDAFWRNLIDRRVSLAEVPRSAWDHALYFDPDRRAPDRTYCRIGGFVQDFVFDWKRFRVPPADAQSVNAMQWMILEAGTQALTPIAATLPKERTSIILGATGLGWQKDSGLRIRLDEMLDAIRSSEGFAALPAGRRDAVLRVASERLLARLKDVSEDNVVGASASVAAGRINMHFDLRGPHYSVDAGFASSLSALDLAVRGLRDGEFDVALTGGASELLSPLELIAFSKLGALASDLPRPFDERTDGTVLGEGVAVFALKRLADAVSAGDKIHALIRGVGGSSDGSGKSMVAPRAETQALAMRRAIADAGEEAGESLRDLQYVECHATGTTLGDATELRALNSVYGSVRERPRQIALGAVKANVGHLRAAAGAAGLLKAVLALSHRVIPPHPTFERPSPRLELEQTPFHVPIQPQPFASGTAAVAAVSAFSFGGNNYHAVLEAFEPKRANRPTTKMSRSPEPLAMIGYGGAFPGANNVPEFWQRLLEGMDRTQSVPKDRYDIARYFDPAGERKDKSYTTLGCFLDRLDTPDPSLRIPPSAHESLDPSHTLCLRSAAEALADARYTPGKWNPERVAVALAFLPYQGKKFLADSRVNYRELESELAKALDENGVPAAQRDALLRSAESRYKRGLPAITEDTLTGHLGNLNAGRIAAHYNFRGPHFVVDAACASTLAALHASVKLLHHGEADVVLSGGVWCDMQPEFFIAACRFNALSKHGSFPFDSRADGFIPGEGAGIVVLKRLSDAERDGDHIRAVLRSVAGSSDGKGRSVLAPSRTGEGAAVARTLEAAKLSPHSVDYVECHGTGTALGDSVEAQALGDVYGPDRNRPLLIGSVKSNIGHLNAAAGIAGLFKAALAVETGIIPASLKCENPSSKLPGTVEVVRQQKSWPSGPEGGARRAGVSSFGVGGANFHALVEQYVPPRGRDAVVSFQGPDERSCLEQAERSPYSAGAHRAQSPETAAPIAHSAPSLETAARVAYTAQSPEDAARKVAMLRHALTMPGPREFLSQAGVFVGTHAASPVAMTFPGQGGQYPNMLRDLARSYPSVQATLDEGDEAYRALCGRALTASFFTDDVANFQQRDEDMHAAVMLANVALYRLLRAHGVTPSVLIGQSAGEIAALVAAESLTLAEGLHAIRARTLAVLSLPLKDPGQMAALGCGASAIPALLAGLPGYAALAADNGPRACIVSADAVAMRTLTQRCQDVGIECSVLAVSHGYHSHLIAGAQAAYQRALEALPFRPPRLSLISSIDGEPYGARPLAELPAFLASQFVLPVLWTQAIQRAHQLGVRLFLEAGPKWSLTQFTREILKDAPHAAMASIHPKVGEHEQFSRMLAFCFVHRVGQLEPTPVGEAMLETSAVPAVAAPVLPHQDAERVLLNLPLAEFLTTDARWRTAVALAAKFQVDIQGASAADLETLETIVALVERRRAEARNAPTPISLAAPSRAPVIDRAQLAVEVRKELLMNAVSRTGYPEEMLGLDLDLEADLGIDTVKQVEIFSRTREKFGLTRDPNQSLRELNTLQKVIDHFVQRLSEGAAAAPAATTAGSAHHAGPQAAALAQPGAPSSSGPPFSSMAPRPAPSHPSAPAPFAAPPPQVAVATVHSAPTAAAPYKVGVATVYPPAPSRPAVDPAEVKKVLLQNAVERTGYPEDMLGLDLDLEADLGIDTVKQVDIFSRTREHFGLERDPNLSLREFNTLQKVIDHFVQRMGQQSAAQLAATSGNPVSASATSVAPVNGASAQPGGNGSRGGVPREDRSVLEALLNMDLTRELGLSEADKQKLGGAFAAQLGQPAPESTHIRTLEQLVRAVTPKRHP